LLVGDATGKAESDAASHGSLEQAQIHGDDPFYIEDASVVAV
jgi:hypothetical protein